MAVNRRSAGMDCRNGFLALHGVALMDIALLMILVMAKVAYIFALSCLAGLGIFTAGAIIALLIRWYVAAAGRRGFLCEASAMSKAMTFFYTFSRLHVEAGIGDQRERLITAPFDSELRAGGGDSGEKP